MRKTHVSLALSKDILVKIDELRKKKYIGASRSFVAELLIRRGLQLEAEIGSGAAVSK